MPTTSTVDTIPEESYNFLNDVLFKYIFGSEHKKNITTGFLNDILQLDGLAAIRDITFKNSELLPRFSDEKLGRLDVYAVTNNGRQIDIEVQVVNYHNMPQRTMFYWSNMYLGASMQGDDYANLPPTITINIMGYNFLPQENPHSRYVLYNPETNHQLTDILELHFIEINKFDTKKPVASMSRTERWMAFLANKLTKKMKEDLMNAEPLINEAYNMANIFMLDEEARLRYINRQMSIRDYNNVRRVAYNDGINHGEKIGTKKGEDNILHIISWLYATNRPEDVQKITSDSEFREKVKAEYDDYIKKQSN